MYKINSEQAKLIFFSIFTIILTYGFALTNYGLTVDNEVPVDVNSSMGLGRWGTNFVQYYLLHGHQPYITLLISLIILGVAAALIADIFRLKGVNSYVFCALFLTFPQLAYQMVFIMQSVGITLGFLLSAIAVQLFIQCSGNFLNFKSILRFIAASLLIMFVTAIYQALILIPAIIYLIHVLQNTYLLDYKFKAEFKNALFFIGLMALSAGLYFLSAKILCPPPPEGGYMASYLSGGKSKNPFTMFRKLVVQNYKGKVYYGEKTIVIAKYAAYLLLIIFAFKRKLFAVRALILLLLLILPYGFSFFITSGYHPPRIYLTIGLVFAFIITRLVAYIKYEKQYVIICAVICIVNMYFISNLYYSAYRISEFDKNIARTIDSRIASKFPDFNPDVDYVFFYGALPQGNYEKFRVPNSEIFGGSIFFWDGGSNGRIHLMFRAHDVASYKTIDNKETYLMAKDSAQKIPVTWPNSESIQKVDNVVIVKLGQDEGQILYN